MNTHSDTLLTLIVPAALEADLVDLLLDAPGIVTGFTTSPANGHGADVKLERPNEKVRGHGRRVRFEIALDANTLGQLRRYLRDALPDANLFYWAVPLRGCGVL